jgi:hypothetical protein
MFYQHRNIAHGFSETHTTVVSPSASVAVVITVPSALVGNGVNGGLASDGVTFIIEVAVELVASSITKIRVAITMSVVLTSFHARE